MEIQLRDYQKKCIETIERSFTSGKNRLGVSMPTGSGKTLTFGSLLKRRGGRSLIIAHREELLVQASDTLKMLGIPDVGILKGDRENLSPAIIVASVQSACRPNRLERLKQCNFDTIVVDESHHASADSYQAIINGLGFGGEDKSKLLLGVTATWSRSDDKKLDDLFDLIFEISIRDLIRDGYLVSPRGKRILTKTSIAEVSETGADYAIGELSEAVNNLERNALIAKTYAEEGEGRQAIAFCVDVQHCLDLAKAIALKGFRVEAVYGDMPSEDREGVIAAFKKGEIDVLTSCGVLTEGFDATAVGCILMARPTKSWSLYVQCIGRGLRLHPGKKDCRVFDFTDNAHRLERKKAINLVSAIEGIEYEGESEEDPIEIKEKKERSLYIPSDRIEELQFFDRSQFAWVGSGTYWEIAVSHSKKIVLTPDKMKPDLYIVKEEIWENGVLHEKNLIDNPLPLSYAQGCAENHVRDNYIGFASKEAAWRAGKATDRQKKTLKKMGIAFSESITSGEASLLIQQKLANRRSWFQDPPTVKQSFFLKKAGVSVPKTKGEAQRMIASLR